MNRIELNLPSENKIKIMIRKLLLTCSCIVLLTVSFNENVYAAQEGELTVVSEELIKLNKEFAELFPIVEKINEYNKLKKSIE